MPNVQACPSVQELQRLVAGSLPPQRAKELAHHLEQCDRCRANAHTLGAAETVGEPAGAGSRPDPQPTYETPPPPALPVAVPVAAGTAPQYGFLAPPQGPGEIGRLGGYRVLELLGAGGMGVVFLAEDVRLKRQVALKVMKPDPAASDAARRRFLREAEAIATVRSDHVVTIYQVSEDRGVPFLAMEFLEGLPLDRWLRGGRKPTVAQVLRLGREIALGLAAAHGRGLIHRDIKPANIWIEAAHGGRVKLLDFGLARALGGDVHLTQSGTIVGTPAYMAPEQARGEKVDARGDLFSLGCVLYQMTTGTLPHRGKDTMSQLLALANETPRPIRELVPEAPPGFSDLVMKLLAKRPQERPPSAQAVADALLTLQEESKRSQPPRPAPAFPRRSLLLAGAPALVLMLLALAGLGWWLAPTVIRVATNKGELVIEADDRDVDVTVRREGAKPQVVVLNHHTQQSLTLTVGDYEIDVQDKDGLYFTTSKPITMKRGDRQVLKVELVLTDARARPGSTRPAPPSALPEGVPVEVVLGDGRFAHWWQVNAVAVSPDGKLIASGGSDFMTRLWDAATGEQRQSFASKGEVLCVAFDPHGERLATGGTDTAVRVWDVQTGKQLFETGMGKPVGTVAFSPDGKRVAALTSALLGLWEADTGKEVFTLELTPNNVEKVAAGLAFSPDGKTLAYRADESVKRCDAATGRAMRDLPLPDKGKTVSCLAYSPDGKLLAVGSLHPNPVVTLLDAEAGEAVRTYDPSLPDSDVVGLVFGPGGGTLAAAFCLRDFAFSRWDGQIRRWDLRTGKEMGGGRHAVERANTGMFCLAGSPDGGTLVTGGGDNVVRRWDAATGAERDIPGRTVDHVRSFALGPDGKTVACGCYDHTIKLLDLGTRQWGRTFRAPESGVWRLAISPDGKTIAAEVDGYLRLWDLKSGELRQAWHWDVAGDRLAFRRDGKLLASVFWGEDALRLWDVQAGKPAPPLEKIPGRMSNSLAFSPDNATLAAGFADVTDVILWDSATGKKKRQLAGSPEEKLSAYALAFSPDGKTLAVAHGTATGPAVKLWDVATGQVRLTLPDCNRAVLDLVFRPDGKMLATAGADDATVRLWDPASGRLLQKYPLGPPTGEIRELAFTPDGKRLAALNANGTVYILHPPD